VSPGEVIRELTASEIISDLETYADEHHDSAIAFDGDGTLWSGDVGEESFAAACRAGKVSASLLAKLGAEAKAFGVDGSGTASELAFRLFEAYRAGHYPELRVCELMIWCYADWTESELRQHVRSAAREPHSQVIPYEPLVPILTWARARSIRCIVVSASPKLVVEECARSLGFASEDIAAGHTTVEAGRLSATLAEPVPYAAAKVTAGRALMGDRHWLCTFGDNVFDLDMLQVARLGIAVRPKDRLRAVLSQVARAAVFKAG
jgi:phosphoserine phosphatase